MERLVEEWAKVCAYRAQMRTAVKELIEAETKFCEMALGSFDHDACRTNLCVVHVNGRCVRIERKKNGFDIVEVDPLGFVLGK